MIFEVLGDLGGDFFGSCEDFEDKNEPKGTKMEGKRQKNHQKVPRSAPRAAKSAPKAPNKGFKGPRVAENNNRKTLFEVWGRVGRG